MNILLLDDLAADARQWLEAQHEVDYRPELLADEGALRAHLYKVEALILPASVPVTATLLDFAPRLVAIGRLGDEGQNIDFDACIKRQVRVVRATGASVRACAEYQLLTLLQLFRGVGAARPVAREINDSVIGLLGMAPAAHVLALQLLSMGARVIAYDPALHRSAELWHRLGINPVSMDELVQTADAVSVQFIYAPRYRGLLDERLLSLCKPGQLWTGTGSAALFDMHALAGALRSGRMGACMLDSTDVQTVAPDLALQQVPRLTITPRLAPRTQEAHARGSWYLADRIHEALLLGQSGQS